MASKKTQRPGVEATRPPAPGQSGLRGRRGPGGQSSTPPACRVRSRSLPHRGLRGHTPSQPASAWPGRGVGSRRCPNVRPRSHPSSSGMTDGRHGRPATEGKGGFARAALRPAPLRLSASRPLVQHQIVAEAAGLPRPCAAHPSAAPGGAVQCSAPHCGCRTARSRRATQPPRCADATYTRFPPRPRRSVDRAQPLGAFRFPSQARSKAVDQFC